MMHVQVKALRGSTDGAHLNANKNDPLGSSNATEEVIENGASLTCQNAGGFREGETEALPTTLPEGTQRHSLSTVASCSTSARGSTLAAQQGASLIEAAAALVCLPGAESQQRSLQDKDSEKAFKWNRKSGGTRALVEKTREAFLLQMAVDTRKAGLPLSFAPLVLPVPQRLLVD